MPLLVTCSCGWKGGLPTDRRCPKCGQDELAAGAPERGLERAPAREVRVIERPRPTEDAPPILEAMQMIHAAGYALVPRELVDGVVATRAAPAPVPVTEYEYAVMIAQSGQVWASGAGIAANTQRPGEDGAAMLLNELAKKGYKVVACVTTGQRAVWTLERPTQHERFVRQGVEPVVRTPATGARIDPTAAAELAGAAAQTGVTIVRRS